MFNPVTLPSDKSSEEAFELYLINNGFEVNLLGGLCPFQIEANHKSGISIYFRARGALVSLEVFDEWYFWDDLPSDELLLWSGKFSCYKKFEASWLDFSDAFYAFHSLWSDAKVAICL